MANHINHTIAAAIDNVRNEMTARLRSNIEWQLPSKSTLEEVEAEARRFELSILTDLTYQSRLGLEQRMVQAVGLCAVGSHAVMPDSMRDEAVKATQNVRAEALKQTMDTMKRLLSALGTMHLEAERELAVLEEAGLEAEAWDALKNS